MSSKRIRQGDGDYTAVWDDWVANGRSRQFERYGSWGGALYRAYVPDGGSDEYPDFYMYASMGPTLISDRGQVTQEGWMGANWEDGFRVEAWVAEDASFGHKVKVRVKEMPNELA
ncbi:MAG: hypothetical protein ACYSYL_00180 [Planctomycetota bacterium]|jgi:hypothetical protein